VILQDALRLLPGAMLVSALALATTPALATGDRTCPEISHNTLRGHIQHAVDFVRAEGVGLGNDMWVSIVDRDGRVCRVAFSGDDRQEQWPGSRVISAQKANTANAFSLRNDYPNAPGVGRALASGNLYGLVQPGGSLYGLQHSNPVDTAIAYGGPDHADGDAANYGRPNDPMVGHFIGGVNVFGGGLALYDHSGRVVGGLGASGDTSCADHIIAWLVRDRLGLDNIPGGVGDNFTNDNLILADPATPNSFEHPFCGFGEEAVIENLANISPPR
jgi:uncharacterized protein GlcG (DUF336 family)